MEQNDFDLKYLKDNTDKSVFNVKYNNAFQIIMIILLCGLVLGQYLAYKQRNVLESNQHELKGNQLYIIRHIKQDSILKSTKKVEEQTNL